MTPHTTAQQVSDRAHTDQDGLGALLQAVTDAEREVRATTLPTAALLAISSPASAQRRDHDPAAVEGENSSREVVDAKARLRDAVERVEAGDPDTDPGVIPDLRLALERARWTWRGLVARHRRAVDDARLARLRLLHAEIVRGSAGDAEMLDVLMAAAEETTAHLLQYLLERKDRVTGWAQRLHSEKVPGYSGAFPEPSPAHGGLAAGGNTIAAGALRVVTGLEPDGVLDTVRHNALNLADGEPAQPQRPVSTYVASEPSPAARFFRDRTSGSVTCIDGVPVPAGWTDRMDEITADEARSTWHGQHRSTTAQERALQRTEGVA